jgi:hypothetical protein
MQAMSFAGSMASVGMQPRYRVFWDGDNVAYRCERISSLEKCIHPNRASWARALQPQCFRGADVPCKNLHFCGSANMCPSSTELRWVRLAVALHRDAQLACRKEHFDVIEAQLRPRKSFSMFVFANRPTARALIEAPEGDQRRPYGAPLTPR